MKKAKKHLIISICLITFLYNTIPSFSCSNLHPYILNEETIKTDEREIKPTTEDIDANLKAEFQEILKNLFSTRNDCIVKLDAETLKQFYNLDIKVSLWAYESEAKKIKYFKNWSEKQSIKFNNIESIIKVRKIKEKEPGLYGILCFVSTEFNYSYIDTPEVPNTFRLGTSHYINLKQDDNRFVITKEWYTDPFADSLNLDNLKSKEVKEYILNHKAPDYKPSERVQKAIDYAHKYCGISTDEAYLFKYNKDYKNFNPDGGDCANFASQILHEGGGFKKGGSWNYHGRSATKAWVNAQGFKNHMVNSGRGSYIAKGKYQEVYKAAYKMRPGDFVAYEKKGKIVHISTVTGLDSKGYPLVTCHNTDRLLVPYDLGWSNSNIKFHLVHMHY
ncbi:amidase domain-containing protein [Cellulosilyticum sp. I15G10I2]|uniref:amidase domain-containing protein n=1 Tax=Cellulosilyticum sp. I15G10I2 TaxID=1892843 RepID=UPI00085C6CB3|nr:amidase domain-containing protein [Cellulosilyticum sp. I15G10I2]